MRIVIDESPEAVLFWFKSKYADMRRELEHSLDIVHGVAGDTPEWRAFYSQPSMVEWQARVARSIMRAISMLLRDWWRYRSSIDHQPSDTLFRARAHAFLMTTWG